MQRPRMLSRPRMSRFFVAGTSMYSPSTRTAHRQHQLLHNGAPGLIIPSSCNIFTCSLIHKISISSGHQRLYPCVPSLVRVPIPVCPLYMIRLWINLIVKETATRRATQSFPLPTLRHPNQVSTTQMLPTNSTTGTRGTIEMSAQVCATFLEYIYQHFLHNFFFLFFKIKAELFSGCSL